LSTSITHSHSLDLLNKKHLNLGLAAETKSLISKKEQVSDEMLAQRVRSSLGPMVSHPSSIELNVQNGKVILSGPILADEVDRLLSHVSAMRGVEEVENRLEAHQDTGNIPGLQGAAAIRKAGQLPDIMQANWSPATRFIAGTAGGALALYGARQLNIVGLRSRLLARLCSPGRSLIWSSNA
jgi:VIT1/CCC1 family predicted Fe2+/Mn2+ transporter